VLLTDKDEAGLRSIAQELGGARFQAGDILTRRSYSHIVDWPLGETGRLDVLVNTAGIWREGPTEAWSSR
jgi:NADP-dependent 3-hydroxy acid dehydrogenase YdfG